MQAAVIAVAIAVAAGSLTVHHQLRLRSSACPSVAALLPGHCRFVTRSSRFVQRKMLPSPKSVAKKQQPFQWPQPLDGA
jgi:hypothetical protein